MADDDKALVERLRANDTEIYLPILGEAADRIEDLSKENDRLNANLAVEAKFVDKLSAENERLNAIVADRLLGSSVDHRTFKDIIAENERLREALEEVIDELQHGYEASALESAKEAVREAK